MKTAIICASAFFLSVFFGSITACAQKPEPKLSASAAALYCVDSGEFLYSENADERLPMASTTKIMTTLLTVETAAAENKLVTVTKDMYAEGSSMYLQAGDRLRLSDLAAGMMMASGNDAANAAALTIGGSIEGFAKLMNEKARQIGMKNSSFVTPSGLDDENHYSTARDMALLMDCAMQNDTFAYISGQKSIKVTFINPEDKVSTYQNHNKLLSLYEYCTGGKTGFTKSAGRCLVTSAEKNGVRLIAVTLNAPDDWNDHIELYSYGFDAVTKACFDDAAYHIKLPVAGGEKDNVNVGAYTAAEITVKKEDADKIKRFVELPQFAYAPIETGQVLGRVVYTLDGKIIASNDLIANEEVNCKYESKSFFERISGFLAELFSFG